MSQRGPLSISTVLLSNFPHDTKDREVENMLRFVPQYEACSRLSKSTDRGTYAFAKFVTPYVIISLSLITCTEFLFLAYLLRRTSIIGCRVCFNVVITLESLSFRELYNIYSCIGLSIMVIYPLHQICGHGCCRPS